MNFQPVRWVAIGSLAMLAIAVVWVCSEWRPLLLSWSSGHHHFAIRSDRGRLRFEKLWVDAVAKAYQGGWSFTFPDGNIDDLNVHPADREWRNGYGCECSRVIFSGPTVVYSRFAIPYWPLMLIAQMVQIVALVKATQAWRRHNLMKAGRCIECGYDLRESAGRCPECGAATMKRV